MKTDRALSFEQLAQWIDTLPMQPELHEARSLDDVMRAFRIDTIRRLRARGEWMRAVQLSAQWDIG